MFSLKWLQLDSNPQFEFGSQVWLNGWVFVYELSGCGFEPHCSHLNFRFGVCFEQGVPWHSGNYRVWIHSETRTWHDKNIQSYFRLFVQCSKYRFINSWKSIFNKALNILACIFACLLNVHFINLSRYEEVYLIRH